MKNRKAAAALAAAALTASTLASGAHAAGTSVPITRIQPDRLERGADPAVAHVQGAWFIDGTTRVKLGKNVQLVGPAGQDHVLMVPGKLGLAKGSKLLRVAEDGTVTLLRRNLPPWDMVVTSNGRRVVHLQDITRRPSKLRSRLRTFDSATGEKLADRVLTGSPQLLGASATKVYFGGWKAGTYTTNLRGGRKTRVARLVGSQVDLSHDLLGGYTGDPYLKGCFKVVRLSRPGRTLWKSCSERVEAFNTDGTGFATVGILSDGIGPNEVDTRSLDGTLLGRYRTRWFGHIRYEDPATVLLEANGRRASALVRCVATECENTTDPVEVSQAP